MISGKLYFCAHTDITVQTLFFFTISLTIIGLWRMFNPFPSLLPLTGILLECLQFAYLYFYKIKYSNPRQWTISTNAQGLYFVLRISRISAFTFSIFIIQFISMKRSLSALLGVGNFLHCFLWNHCRCREAKILICVFNLYWC